MTPKTSAGPQQTPAEPALTNTYSQRQDSAARRIRLHHTFVRRRRWSRELDAICRGDAYRRCA